MTSQSEKIPKTRLGFVANLGIALLALAGTITMQWTQLNRSSISNLTPSQLDQQEAQRLKLLNQLPTLGFDNLIANWTFLNFIQYFGDNDVRSETGYATSVNYFDVITQRDPRFIEIYPFLTTAISYYAGKPEITIKFIDRGTNVISPEKQPQAYLVWVYKALDQLLLLGDIPGAIHSYEMAIKWVAGTSAADAGPFYQQSVNFLKKDPDSTQARFLGWSQVYYQSVDKYPKERAKQELLKLGAKMQTTPDGEVHFILPQSKMK